MRRALAGVGFAAILMGGAALVAGAQGPPPPPPLGDFGPPGDGMGGPMTGLFEFGLMGGFGGKVVTGKPILASITITRTETLPGNSISNTTTGTFARAADGSTYRDVKFAAIGPWAASGKAREFIYIRNLTTGMQYAVNVAKGNYHEFPIREKVPKDSKDWLSGSDSSNETVNDNPSGTYTDPVTNAVYPVDDRKVTRTIPAGAIGNQFPIVVISERWYSSALDLLVEDTHTDPRFGTTTYQLSNIGESPASSLFTPDPSLTLVQGGFGKSGSRGGKQPPPPPQPPPPQN